MKTYVIITERWSRDAVECTFHEIEEQAEIYRRDSDDDDIEVHESTAHCPDGEYRGCVVDNTGERVAVEKEWYDLARENDWAI
jgi:hypothetical protein